MLRLCHRIFWELSCVQCSVRKARVSKKDKRVHKAGVGAGDVGHIDVHVLMQYKPELTFPCTGNTSFNL